MEKMMVEQITVAHHRILALHAQAAQAESPEMLEVLNASRNEINCRNAAAVPGPARVSFADHAEKCHGRQTTKPCCRRSANRAGRQEFFRLNPKHRDHCQIPSNQKKALTHEISPTSTRRSLNSIVRRLNRSERTGRKRVPLHPVPKDMELRHKMFEIAEKLLSLFQSLAANEQKSGHQPMAPLAADGPTTPNKIT